MSRIAEIVRNTKETQIQLSLGLDDFDTPQIETGIGFFDHMLILWATHGMFKTSLKATGDLHVDVHHTVEDVGLALGQALDKALGDRVQIERYGHAVTPMDETLAAVSVDLSKRPYLVFQAPRVDYPSDGFNLSIAKEFFRAFSNQAGMNLHLNVAYGENEHHIIEALFKATGRALSQAVRINQQIKGVRSTKGVL